MRIAAIELAQALFLLFLLLGEILLALFVLIVGFGQVAILVVEGLRLLGRPVSMINLSGNDGRNLATFA